MCGKSYVLVCFDVDDYWLNDIKWWAYNIIYFNTGILQICIHCNTNVLAKKYQSTTNASKTYLSSMIFVLIWRQIEVRNLLLIIHVRHDWNTIYWYIGLNVVSSSLQYSTTPPNKPPSNTSQLGLGRFLKILR